MLCALTRLSLVLAVTLPVLGGCGHKTPPLVVSGYSLNPEPWLEDRKTVAQRASFDLNCPAEQIEVTVLAVGGNGIWYSDWATQVGAAGCNQRAVYIRTLQGWLANIAGADAKKE